MSILQINVENFDQHIRESDKPVLLYWGPKLSPTDNVLLDLEGSFGGLLVFAELDEKDEQLAFDYGLEDAGIIMFNSGEEICRGGRSDLEHLSEWVSRAIDIMLSAGGHSLKQSKYVSKRGQQKIQSTVTKKKVAPRKKPAPEVVKEVPKVAFEKVDDKSFTEKVLQKSGDVLVLFVSEKGCLSRTAQERISYQLGRVSYQIHYVRVLAEESPELMKRYQVTQVPSLLLLRDGHIVTAELGTQPIMLTRWIDVALQYAPKVLKEPHGQEHTGKMGLKKARSRFNRLRKADHLGYLGQQETIEA